MKRFMQTCYKCNCDVKPSKVKREGIELNCMHCPECNEDYFTSSELIKFDILTGKRKNIRKFGTLGDSTIMRIPTHILKAYKIKPGDYGVFEEKSEGILIKTVPAKEVKA
ncbi:MAG: AbrB/MazE/SpoVT family DNA-binding domain-containing protein [Nanoarchaeota archaeon]|nr:AbrB/MazE/SpoVT family DNA-binding domain-containing protein [Nanoarchaeota archaeon]MBU1975292.1 AbrB/MazE/SpoVT family DNA-binding domain-containing protein [Nanoarchaeota archaeon]